MLNRDRLLNIVSGREKGIGASFWKSVLWSAQNLYAIGIWRRNRKYDRGIDVAEVPVPVISVGNITTGGTGKTPVVAWIAKWLRDHEMRVAILSRGYGATDGGLNDEGLELELRLPDVPHLQDRDRVQSAITAISELDSQVLVLDDAFQHRRLRRDLDIVLLDATNPFGFNYLLPRGLLREPLSSLKRADAIILTRTNQISADERAAIQKKAMKFARKEVIWLDSVHRPSKCVRYQQSESPASILRGKRVFAISGIGNPAAFQKTLVEAGAEVVGSREFPDHHRYTRDEIKSVIEELKKRTDVDCAVCTMKDLVKIQLADLGPVPLFGLAIDIEFTSGQAELESTLEKLISRVEQTGD